MKRNSTHGTANQMLEAFRNKVDDLEAQDSLGASVDIHAAEDEWDETENEFRTDYLPDLRASVERELRELDTIDSWSWSELDDSLVLTVVVGDKVEEFDIPFSDIYQGVSTDVDYIMKAVNHTVDSCTNITASSDIVTLVDFLSEHDQAYEDAQHAFGVDDLMDLSYEELYSWIADHDQLFEDLCEYDPSFREIDGCNSTKSIKSSDDLDEDSEWFERESKDVSDGGFITRYTLYQRCNDDSPQYVCVFGDPDLYKPEDEDWDFETDDESEAYDWFESF